MSPACRRRNISAPPGPSPPPQGHSLDFHPTVIPRRAGLGPGADSPAGPRAFQGCRALEPVGPPRHPALCLPAPHPRRGDLGPRPGSGSAEDGRVQASKRRSLLKEGDVCHFQSHLSSWIRGKEQKEDGFLYFKKVRHFEMAVRPTRLPGSQRPAFPPLPATGPHAWAWHPAVWADRTRPGPCSPGGCPRREEVPTAAAHRPISPSGQGHPSSVPRLLWIFRGALPSGVDVPVGET